MIDRLRDLLREALDEQHQTGLLTDHHNPKVTTGWEIGPIETCPNRLCVEGLRALAESAPTDWKEFARLMLDKSPEGRAELRRRALGASGRPPTPGDGW